MPRDFRLRVRGFPRNKKSRPLNLGNEIQKKGRVLRIDATMGIVGLPGSGRKTLAYRLANINRGDFQSVPVANCYTASYGRMFEGRMSYSRFLIRVNIYIFPEPEMPTSITRSGATRCSGPSLFYENWDDFCCLVMIFDVKNSMSFHFVSMYLSDFRRDNLRIPTCFLVGNKSDRRNEVLPIETAPHEHPVPVRTACIEARNIGASYFELSAKYNIDVEPLFQRILERAVLTLRNWQDF